jgi:hypothetical protein
MGIRKETRLRIALPVDVSGIDASGMPFEQNCMTVNLTVHGLQVEGLMRPLQRGAMISVRYGAKLAPARVVWSGTPETDLQGHVGLHIVGGWNNFWGRAIPHIAGDALYKPTNMGVIEPEDNPRPAANAAPVLFAGSGANASQQDEEQLQIGETLLNIGALAAV